MKLTHLSDDALHEKLKELSREERKLTIEVLHHLREFEKRMLAMKRGHPGLLEYCMSELGYTKSAAQRRIDSMRVLKHVPEVESKIIDGSLSLSHLSEAQSFFRKEEIRDAGEKKEILDQLVGKSVVQAQRQLMSMTDQPEIHIPERTRVVSEELTEVRFVVDQETLDQIEELKALLSQASPGMGIKEVLQYGLELALKKHRVKKPEQVALVPTSVPAVKREVYHRDQGSCTYVDLKSGRRCASRRFLEYDHIKPKALGGSNASENLRLRCRAHNQLAAVQVFGAAKMRQFLPRIRG